MTITDQLSGVHVDAVHRAGCYAIRSDGMVGRITAWFAGDGEDSDADAATAAMVEWPDGLWSAVDLAAFTPAPMQ